MGPGESYLGDVGQVFAGYGDNLNPVNWYNGASYLFDTASSKDVGAAGGALLNGIGHSLTAWATTGDPREFGQSFGTVLTTAASVAAPFAEISVFRVYGGESWWGGKSWTFIDPRYVPRFRNWAGLPNVNTGRFLIGSKIRLYNLNGMKLASPLDGNRGLLPELIIRNANSKIKITDVCGLNPEF